MQINPGGRLASEDVVGRDALIDRYWRVLERQSLILSAERRIGKTSVVQKMEHDGRDGFDVFYKDLEDVHSLIELTRAFYTRIGERLGHLGRVKAKAVAAWSALVPRRVKDIDLPEAKANWKALVRGGINDLLVTIPDKKIVLIWDELPLMLYNIGKREGADAAIQLLDLLRQLRQEHNERLRFVFTGSVGLHLVLRDLRVKGNANEATNDMLEEPVPPLGRIDGIGLARELLLCCSGAEYADIDELAEQIFECTDGFPYFIHHVVDGLAMTGKAPDRIAVDEAVRRLVAGNHDPAHMRYFESRIKTYYDEADAPIALSMLDVIAAADEALSLDAIANLARHQHLDVKDEKIRELLGLLRRDQYLELDDSTRSYRFRWRLVRRWWRANRS